MTSGPLRGVVVAVILLLLSRAALGAWRNRRLAVTVWRAMTVRHVAGAGALLVVVASVGGALLTLPLLHVGAGQLLGFAGNAVFAPLEAAAVRATPSAPSGPDWALIALATGFLAFLALLLPWLAFVEEEIFRAGLEEASVAGQLWSALRFGAVHLVMLVPVAATLAIALAGFCYGRVYRAGYRRAAHGSQLPPVVLVSFRAPRRARRAAAQARLRALAERPLLVTAGPSATAAGAPLPVDPTQRQAAGVFASTVWHTTFNTLVIVLLWGAIVWGALA